LYTEEINHAKAVSEARRVLGIDLEHSELCLNLLHKQGHQDFIECLRAFLDDRLQLLQLTFQLL